MRWSRSAPVLALLLIAPCAPVLALDAPRKLVDYDIQVELKPKEKLVEGHEVLKWTNPSGDRVAELRFHLYWNAFRNNRSTFFKESGGELRGDKADKESGWGYIDVTRMTWDGQDLAKGMRFDAPDDGNKDDRTVLVVPLPRPVEPGETVSLDIAWTSRAPRVFARAGYVRDFFMMGQWFPKIGVYEGVGVRRRHDSGWNCHQYHANSEFYADFGDYKVAITVPKSFVVASAGALVDEKASGDKKTLTFQQDRIHDFAWTADPRYVVKETLFDPAKDLPAAEVERAARLLGRTPAQMKDGFRPVKLRYYMQPDHEDQWVRYDDAQKWALVWLGLYAFPYPYDQISIIDPPEDGSGAAGMEYQTLYTAGTFRRLGRWPLDKVRFQELVVVHEFGHGYWMGMVASNEFEESWMDEGINSFTEYEMCTRRWGNQLEVPPGVGFTPWDTGAAGLMIQPDYDPIIRHSWGYRSSSSYGRNSYPRTATTMQQVRKMMGEEVFWRGFKAYAERWRFDHPTSDDFFDALESSLATGGDLARMAGSTGASSSVATLSTGGAGEFSTLPTAMSPGGGFDVAHFRAFVSRTWRGTGSVDFRVLSATSEKHEEVTGYDDARKAVNFEVDDSKKGAKGDARKKKDEKAKKSDGEKGPFDSRVVIGRDGTIDLPVEVVLTFANGKSYKTRWNGVDKWLRLSTIYPSRLVKVEVDPDRKIVLDKDPWNNARYLKGWKGASATSKVRAYAFHLVEILFSTLWTLA